jgi:hypothetical protein
MNASVFRHRGELASGHGSSGRNGASVPLAIAALMLPLAAAATATLFVALFGYVLFAVAWRVSAAAATRLTNRRGEAVDVDDDDEDAEVIQHRPCPQTISEIALSGLATAA